MPIRSVWFRPFRLVMTWFMILFLLPAPLQARDQGQVRESTANHAKLTRLQGPFDSGQDVTRACLGCHTEAARQIQQTLHWTWRFQPPGSGRLYGKQYVFNTFCGSVRSNWNKCTSCHIGYGWKDPAVTTPSEDQVDCLVCHEQTGKYVKYDYGYPVLTHNGRVLRKPDLAPMARQVGIPNRQNCGSCHFQGGAQDGAKHGDLDSSLLNPPPSLDVHMSPQGQDFSCVTCHAGWGHRVTGSRYRMKARDPLGIDRPGHTDASRSSCESCHGERPHRHGLGRKLNDHTDRVACQTCHIPAFARGGVRTKTFWDWSDAGRDQPSRVIPPRKNAAGTWETTHSHHHGTITWGENLIPEYRWFNGQVDYLQLGEVIDDRQPVPVNRMLGQEHDPQSRIWPFKRMRAILPYDPVNKILVINHSTPENAADEEAFYRSHDWSRSVAAGMKTPGAPPFSGQVGFVEAHMFFPITHMVAPGKNALGCQDCHARNGRMKGLGGVYLPGRDFFPNLNRLGLAVVLLVVAGVVIHGLLRHRARRRTPPPPPPTRALITRRERFFTVYERLWHWGQAALILGLISTGFSLSGLVALVPFEAATRWHGVLAWALLALWISIFFWLLVVGEWRQYIQNTDKLRAMLRYYLTGIFQPHIHHHPFKKTRRLKHNPLQRLTYLILYLVIIPVVAGSGLLYLYANDWPGLGLEGLQLFQVAGVHVAIAFVLVGFLILHVYMAFIGEPPTAMIKAMVTGFLETRVEDLDMSGDYQVLLVEDDGDFALLIQSWLNKRAIPGLDTLLPPSLTIIRAETLAAAFRELRKENYDLILLDLGLPDSDGLATFTQLQDAFSDIPILVLTAYQEEATGAQAVHQGAQDFLAKEEITSRKLARAIRFALERHQYTKDHSST
ncbi:MAG: tetrathionate reductase family octaheme c-type cytochrome [Magnetococcales bacterium]|nr:tetrathionate reductase family octaheme c-type cytochrome [Magnetococcales bacterium]